jgi:hypothetical protein
VPDKARTGFVDDLDSAGMAAIPDLVDAATCADLLDAVRRSAGVPSSFYRCLSPSGQPAVESDLFRWRDVPEILDLVVSPPLVEAASRHLGTSDPIVLEDQWFWSHPGSSTESPWHQDEPYHPLDRPFLTVWLPLTAVPAGLGIKGVAGSHLGPTYAPIEFSAQEQTLADATGSAALPTLDHEPGPDTVLAPDVGVGGAVLIDSRTLHSAGGPCDTEFIRLSIRYAHPDTRRRSRAWPIADFWHEWAWSDGDRLPPSGFPRVSEIRARKQETL